MIDLGCLIVVGIIVWCVASEGVWGAASTFFCVLFSGLLAMNFFEPLANFLDGMLGQWNTYSDILAMVGLFIAFIFAMRLGIEQLSPTFIQVYPLLDQGGRWFFAALSGYLTMAFLLTALHTAPLPREFLGFKAERANFFGMAPDRQWLGFVQYITEKPLGWDIYETKTVPPMRVAHAFDGRYESLGDRSAPYPNTIWPSFPIRYASRRTQLGGGPAVVPIPVTVPARAPAGAGGGAAGGGGAVQGF